MIAERVGSALDLVMARLHQWLETMRGTDGYGGPVVHWWRDCLLFCGAGLDWRYEGIIAGYLTLFERSNDSAWLGFARRAADDLVRGQLLGGHYRNSEFELNPGVGGTPHEAAADVGLLLLARLLRDRGLDGWERYLDTAEQNLRRCYVERLWSESELWFRDDPRLPSFVPNKSATLIEALCLLADLTQQEDLLEQYVRPTADAILAHQIGSRGTRMDGAIAQSTNGRMLVEKYFPYYNARCVPGLVAAYERLGDGRYLEGALAAMTFVKRWQEPDGAFPQVIYGNGHVNRYPRWVAAVADVLSAVELLRPFGLEFPMQPSLDWLLAGQLPGGFFATAEGFGSLVSQEPPDSVPDFRDVLPVVGWNDKPFRFLATRGSGPLPESGGITESHLPCRWHGDEASLTIDENELRISTLSGRTPIRWRKSQDWAEVAVREL